MIVSAAAMARKIVDEVPEARVIRNRNAFSNAPMLAINNAMGFQVASVATTWEVSRDEVLARSRTRIVVTPGSDTRKYASGDGSTCWTPSMRDRLMIVSVNVSKPKVLLQWSGGEVISSIDKQRVAADHLSLSPLNLAGDEQADTRPTPGGGQVHGGPHAAVYAFPSEHYPRISELVGESVGPGFMGENVTTAGIEEADACIGDIWRWGDARLQISAPRGPCYKLGIRMGRQAARTAIREEALVGWYLRVLVPGRVPTRGDITVEERHPDSVSVAQLQRAINDRDTAYPDLAALAPLTPAVARALQNRGRDIFGGVPETD